jgi:ABC-type uncharacterized transport system permease subunit
MFNKNIIFTYMKNIFIFYFKEITSSVVRTGHYRVIFIHFFNLMLYLYSYIIDYKFIRYTNLDFKNS